jgi:uncharacterized membrane protein
MASNVSIAKHPVHPMLVPFPIGLWVFSLVADVIFLRGWGGPVWNDVAFYTMAGGTVAALLAAPFGLLDLLSLRAPDTRRIGWIHMSLNLLIVATFAVDLWLRTRSVTSAGLPVTLSAVAVLMLLASGWLGGEMVYVHGAGVEPPAARRETQIRTEVREQARRA